MRSRYLVINHNPLFGKCPLCNDFAGLHRSHGKRFKEHLLLALYIYRLYRCRSCGWRGFLFTLIFSRKTLTELCFYTGVAGAACFVVLQVLRRLA